MKHLIRPALQAAAITLAAVTGAHALSTQRTNTANLVLADVCDGTFTDFRFQVSAYDDQVFVFRYDVVLDNVACLFRITKPMDGTIYLDVPLTDITVSGTNVTFSIARTNIPPPGSYYGELISYEAATTNYYRSLAQGMIPVTWSLYLNESNFFARATNTAGVGQVYVHPSWIDPPWLSTNAGLGNIYATLVSQAALSNYAVSVNTRVTAASNHFAAVSLTNAALAQATSNHVVVAGNLLTIYAKTNYATVASTNDVTRWAEMDAVTNVDLDTWSISNGAYYGNGVGLTNLVGETDPRFTTSAAASVTGALITNWNTAYGWGNHATNSYATGTPVYAESDPVWEAAKSGYATGTPIYAETDPVWVSAKGAYDGATNALDVRATALEGATGALNTAVGALNDATGALNTAVGSLQAATNALDARDIVENWSLYPALQNINAATYAITNVTSITAAEGGLPVLDEPFTNDVFEAGTWTNVSGVAWQWSNGGYIYDTGDGTASNVGVLATIGRTYAITVEGLWGTNGINSNIVQVTYGGVALPLVAEYGTQLVSTQLTAISAGALLIESLDTIDQIIVASLTITDITPSNDVAIARVAADRITLGGETRTNWPATNDFAALAAATNALDIRVDALEGGAGGTYPVFLLPVGALEGSWTDFEIKASTNNFTSDALYWWKSWTSQPLQNDADAIALFTDPYAGADPRTLYRRTTDVSIATHLASADSTVEVVIFQPSHNVEGGDTWMTPANTNLVWEWIRVDEGGYEMTPDGSNYWFHPILPEQWMAAPLGQWEWAEIHTAKLAAAYAETYVTWRTNTFDGTNAVYFLNPHNQSNYVIFTP